MKTKPRKRNSTVFYFETLSFWEQRERRRRWFHLPHTAADTLPVSCHLINWNLRRKREEREGNDEQVGKERKQEMKQGSREGLLSSTSITWKTQPIRGEELRCSWFIHEFTSLPTCLPYLLTPLFPFLFYFSTFLFPSLLPNFLHDGLVPFQILLWYFVSFPNSSSSSQAPCFVKEGSVQGTRTRT